MSEEPKRPQINWTQVFAGALAAVSSAVLLSTVGVAGTIIGAALGSVAVTLGSAIYSYYLAATKRRLAKVQDAALTRVARARESVNGAAAGAARDPRLADEELAAAGQQLEQAREELEEESPVPRGAMWREVLAKLPWRRIGLSAVGIFVLAVGVITAFELLTGRELSSYTGGSSDHQGPRTSIVGFMTGGRGNAPSPSPSGTSSESPTPGGTRHVPVPGASTVPTPGATATEQPTPRPRSTGTTTPSSRPSSTPTTATPPPSPAPTHISTPSPPSQTSLTP